MEPNEERQGNDKKAERLAKRRERGRQCLLEETAEEREARLGKRREALKKRLLKRKVSKVLSSQRYIPMILSLYKLKYDIRPSIFDYLFTIFQ
jgi:hypothetical protein